MNEYDCTCMGYTDERTRRFCSGCMAKARGEIAKARHDHETDRLAIIGFQMALRTERRYRERAEEQLALARRLHDQMTDNFVKARERLDVALAVLRDVEWEGEADHGVPGCPCCNGEKPSDPKFSTYATTGHSPDCALKKVLDAQ